MNLFKIIWEMKNPIKFTSKHFIKPIQLFMSKIFNQYKEKTTERVLNLREILFKAGVIALITSCVVWLSVFLYIAFYYSYIPNITHSRPVHLQYKSCNENQGICSFPASHVELTRSQKLLMVGQSYRIKLVLDMPNSETNKLLGMFLCCIELRAKGGLLVSGSCRSGMLPYQSPLTSLMSTLIYSPLLISGFKEEKRTVEVELFSDFEDNQETPVTDVYIELQSRFIQVYSATLHIEAHFTGLRYIMFHWPFLSAVVGISTNLLFVAFVCALSWYHLQMADEDRDSMEDNFNMKSSCEDQFFLDSEEFQESLSIKEKKEGDDSHSSDVDSFEDTEASTSKQFIKTIKKEI